MPSPEYQEVGDSDGRTLDVHAFNRACIVVCLTKAVEHRLIHNKQSPFSCLIPLTSDPQLIKSHLPIYCYRWGGGYLCASSLVSEGGFSTTKSTISSKTYQLACRTTVVHVRSWTMRFIHRNTHALIKVFSIF